MPAALRLDFLLRSLLVVFFVAACGKSDQGHSGAAGTGSLFVAVRDARGALVPNAIVTTTPKAARTETDAAGTALFGELAPGFYEVLAVHPNAGAASDVVSVEAGEIARVELSLSGVLSNAGSGGSGAGGSGGKSGSGGAGSTGATGGKGTGGAGGTKAGSAGHAGVSDSAGAAGSELGGAAGAAGENNEAIVVGADVAAMLVDPARPYLYAIDSGNNSLLFVNLEQRKVEKTLFVGSNPVDLDINDDASAVYVANFGSTAIARVDLDAQTSEDVFVDTEIQVWDGNPFRLALTTANTLVFTSEDQWNDLKLVDATTGVNITATGSVYYPDLVASPDRTRVYVGESGGTGSKLHRFDVTATSLTESDTSTEVSGFGSRLVVTSGDGAYVFYAQQKYLASNLKSVLGQFSEVIYAANHDGSVVVGNTNVFDGTKFSVLRPLVVATTVMAMSADGGTLYLFDPHTQTIELQNLD